jgi:ketosteroid isomerase-like protein
MLSDDVLWTATGRSPVSGAFRGKQEHIERVYRPLDHKLATWLKPAVERVIANGDWGTVQFSSTGGLGTNGTTTTCAIAG